MAKSHYSFKKRKKELARKLKQEEKRKRRLNKDKITPEENPDQSQDEVENLQAEENPDPSQDEIENPKE